MLLLLLCGVSVDVDVVGVVDDVGVCCVLLLVLCVVAVVCC